jgi:hypothetical protein
MQVQDRQACPACGADNALDASFCWKCFQSFAPAQPAGARPGMALVGAAVPPAPPAASTSRAGGPKRIVAVVVGIVVALAVSGAVRSWLRPDYHVPEAIGAMPRVHTSGTDEFERRMTASGAQNNVDVEAAAYGSGVDPQIFLVLANGRSVEDTDQLFREFLSGAESSGATVDRAHQTTGVYRDAEWRCVPVRASAVTASACMWHEDVSVGITLDLAPNGDASGALFGAYDASHD